MKNNNKNGFALTKVLLALAITSVVAITTVSYFLHTNNDKSFTSDASLIVTNSERSMIGNTQKFDGNSFKQASANTGTVVATTSNCGQLQASLAQFGTVQCNEKTLTFHRNDVTNNLVPVADSLSAGTEEAGAKLQIKPVDLSGTLNLSAQISAGTVTPPGAGGAGFNPTNGSLGGVGTMGGTAGGIDSGTVLSPGVTPITTPYTGTGTLNAPSDPPSDPPATPPTGAPILAFAFWGSYIDIVPVPSATSYKMGLSCLTSAGYPTSPVPSTVSEIPLSAMKTWAGSVFDQPYTGPFLNYTNTSPGYWNSLPQSACAPFAQVSVWVQSCTSSTTCSAWSEPKVSFCSYDRC